MLEPATARSLPSTDQLYLRDAYQRTMAAEVIATDADRVALDRTVFYATGGGQPHDTGMIEWDDVRWLVTDVRSDGKLLWHTLALQPGVRAR